MSILCFILRRLSRIARWWADFRHRFTPAIAVRLATKGLKEIPTTINVPKEKLDYEYKSTIAKLDANFPNISFLRPISNEDTEKAGDVLDRELGFRLTTKESSIPGAGRGIFVSSGSIRAGCIASVYPGTIYDPWDSIFLQSIGNHFVLRCQDSVTIDGNDRRLSAYIFRSCAFRDLSPAVCDLSWLTSRPFNFLNSGQYVNNDCFSHNVQYIDLDIQNWPFKYRKFLPYAVFSPHRTLPLRVVLLVAVRNINPGEELLSAYISK